MPDAEKEYTTLTRLALISRRAKEELRCQFTSLAHFLNEGFLQDCYFGLGRDRPSGVDGISWKKYGEHLEENLKDLVKRMKAKRYRTTFLNIDIFNMFNNVFFNILIYNKL